MQVRGRPAAQGRRRRRSRSSARTRACTACSSGVRPAASKALRASPGKPPGKSRRLSGSPPPRHRDLVAVVDERRAARGEQEREGAAFSAAGVAPGSLMKRGTSCRPSSVTSTDGVAVQVVARQHARDVAQRAAAGERLADRVVEREVEQRVDAGVDAVEARLAALEEGDERGVAVEELADDRELRVLLLDRAPSSPARSGGGRRAACPGGCRRGRSRRPTRACSGSRSARSRGRPGSGRAGCR